MRLCVSSACALVPVAVATARSETGAPGSGGGGTTRVAPDGATCEVRRKDVLAGKRFRIELTGDGDHDARRAEAGVECDRPFEHRSSARDVELRADREEPLLEVLLGLPPQALRGMAQVGSGA